MTAPNTVCHLCRKPFYAVPSRLQRGLGRFCSSRCSKRSQPKIPPEDRFWSKVNKISFLDCWDWTANVGTHGYGQITISSCDVRTAHRFSYELAFGSIPPKSHVLHKCDNKRCVNPLHLYLGWHNENQHDRETAGTDNSGERNGMSKLSDDQVLLVYADPRKTKFVARDFNISPRLVNLIRRAGHRVPEFNCLV